MAYQTGHARCSVTGTIFTSEPSVRSFHASVSTPPVTDRAENPFHTGLPGFDAAAGGLIEVRFYQFVGTPTSAVPVEPPDNITIAVYDSNGGLVKTLANAIPPPANGTAYPFYFTVDGNSGSGDRCGQYEVRITAVRTSGTGGVGNYNVGSDTQGHRGMIRGNMKVTDISSTSSQNGGGPHYYGVAGDNSIATTVTHTRPHVTNGSQTMKKSVLTGTSQFIDKGTENATGTSTTWVTFANNEYSDASASYGSQFEVIGSGPLHTGEKWTEVLGSGNAAQNGVTIVRRTSYYTVDPRITIQGVTLGKTLYNRGESTTIDFSIKNAGNASLTRSVPLILRDSTGTAKATPTDTGSNYDINYTPGVNDDASFDTVGKQWTFETNLADAYNQSANAWKLSRKLLIGSAPGSNSRVIQTDKELYNRGESPTLTYNLSYARGDALASRSINTRVHDNAATSNEEDLQVKTTSGAGGVSYSYTIGSGDKATFDAVGSPKHVEADWAGNTTEDSIGEWRVSNKLLVPGYVDDVNTGDFWTGKADLDVDNNGDPDSAYETDFYVGADVLFAKTRVQNIRGEDYDDAAITMWVVRGATIESGPVTGAVSQTESGFTGHQDLFYNFDVKAPAGARVVRMEATRSGNTTGNATFGGYLTRSVNFAPSYTGNLFMEVNYDAHELVKDQLRFTLTPVIFDTSNSRQLLSTVTPAAVVDIAPKYHVTVHEAAGAPSLVINQTAMTNIANDDQWQATITGLSAYKGKTINVHVVMTLNGGQVQASFPIVVGPFKNKKVLTKFNPALGSVQS